MWPVFQFECTLCFLTCLAFSLLYAWLLLNIVKYLNIQRFSKVYARNVQCALVSLTQQTSTCLLRGSHPVGNIIKAHSERAKHKSDAMDFHITYIERQFSSPVIYIDSENLITISVSTQ